MTSLDGETGLRIAEAILSGQRDPAELVNLRDPGVRKSTVAEMEAALQGRLARRHLWVSDFKREIFSHQKTIYFETGQR